MQTSPTCIRRSIFLYLIVSACFALVCGASSIASAQTASQLACSPCAVNFGTVPIGGSDSAAVTLSNPGTSPITISGKSKVGQWYFTYRGLTLPYQLGAGQSVTFNMIFAPQNTQLVSGSFSFTNSASSTPLHICGSRAAT